MYKCINCGGDCVEQKNGRYKCDCCGNTFSESELSGAVVKKTSPKPAEKDSPSERNNLDAGAFVFNKNINGILEITYRNNNATWSGSGYLITADGFAITNAHVVALDNGSSCGECEAKIAGETVKAVVVAMGTDQKSKHCTNLDLALIKLSRLPSKATVLTFGDYSNVLTGETVFVIGNSLGAGTCITSGIVSDRSRYGQLMTDCPVNGGNSGGPIFNKDGEVIGTVVASGRRYDGSDAEGMNYAIPSSEVLAFLSRVSK